MIRELIAGVNAMETYYWDDRTDEVYRLVDGKRVQAPPDIATIVREKLERADKPEQK